MELPFPCGRSPVFDQECHLSCRIEDGRWIERAASDRLLLLIVGNSTSYINGRDLLRSYTDQVISNTRQWTPGDYSSE